MSVEQRVFDIVSEHFAYDKEKITRNTTFIEDIGADSLDIVEFVMELEEEFDIQIPDDQAEKIKTVGEAVDYIDNAVKKFMQDNAVRAGSLTILKNGAVRHQRAYTWAEEDYPITEVNSLFRLASCSKAFTAAAIQRLVDDKKLNLSDKAFAKAGITSKALSS